jgi:hypothetical protein
MAALLQVYESVLIPFGNGRRYDLVVDDDGKFLRVQCKTGHIRSGAILFNSSSMHAHRGGTRRDYRGQAELFGVYCPQNRKVYLVPVEDVGERMGSLRLEPAKNNQQAGVRWADKYEVKPR